MSIAGVNLKMYMSVAETAAWLCAVAAIETTVEVFVLPTHVSLPDARGILGPVGFGYGAQDVSPAVSGPYTGEVSAGALAELGCHYAAIGHAERRRRFGEADATVAAKASALASVGIVPVACIGELEPNEGHDRPIAQMDAVLTAVPADSELIFAYEPVWAIGASAPPPAEHIIDMATHLRARYSSRPGRTRLLYGGSAGPGLFTQVAGSVDGLFLGRFAHDLASFRSILGEMESPPTSAVGAGTERPGGDLRDAGRSGATAP